MPRNLLRSILRLHKLRLPSDQQALGDAYVKAEFKLHRDAKPEFVAKFMAEWQSYRDPLANSRNWPSAPLSADQLASLSGEQREQLDDLKKAAEDVATPGGTAAVSHFGGVEIHDSRKDA